MKIQVILLCATLLLFSCSEDVMIQTKPKNNLPNGNLIVDNGVLSNPEGSPVQLRGVSTHGIQYFDEFFQDEKMIKALGASDGWNADVVRVSLYAREEGYEDNPAYFTKQVDRLVKSVTDNGMFAIIDWHQLHPGDPNMDKENAIKFFTHMAQKHGSNKDVIFEICNEPNNSGAFDENWNEIPLDYNVTWSGHIKPYAEEIIPIIREYSNNVIIVGTPEWGSAPDEVIGDELDFSNIMYSMHFYAAEHKEYERANLQRAIDADLPLFITEFGTQNAAGEGENDFAETEKWFKLLDENNISWCNWNYSNDWRSGAIFKTYVNSADSALIVEHKGEWWDMPADVKETLENAEEVSFTSVEDYYDESKMKEAGVWIKDKIRNR